MASGEWMRLPAFRTALQRVSQVLFAQESEHEQVEAGGGGGSREDVLGLTPGPQDHDLSPPRHPCPPPPQEIMLTGAWSFPDTPFLFPDFIWGGGGGEGEATPVGAGSLIGWIPGP